MTIHELARRLGISAATVSLALKGDPRVAERTRQRVQEEAQKSGFHVNEQARNLRLGRSGLVAMVVHDISGGFWAGAAAAAEQELGGGRHLVVCNSYASVEKERSILADLAARRIDGLIIQPADNCETAHLAELNRTTPVVLFERSADPELSYVKGDDRQAGYQAITALVDDGRRNIAFLAGQSPRLHYGLQDRLEGVEAALRAHRLLKHTKIIPVPISDSVNPKLPDNLAAFDAILCSSSGLGLPVLRKLQEQHIQVPQQVALLMWDNAPFAEYVQPSLSCIGIPVRQMGAEAAAVIRARLEGRTAPAHCLIPQPFFWRESFSPRT